MNSDEKSCSVWQCQGWQINSQQAIGGNHWVATLQFGQDSISVAGIEVPYEDYKRIHQKILLADRWMIDGCCRIF